MKRIKFEYLLPALALLFLVFTLGWFLGRNESGSTGGVTVLETEFTPVQAALQESDSEEEPEAAPAAVQDTTETDDPAAQEAVEFPLNINTATVEELQALPEIGPALAEKIVSHRETFGTFASPEDIMLVSGIGEKRFAAIQSFITTEDEP